VTFLSDRDGQMDVWVGQIGTGQFYNLTRGKAGEIVNPSVRALAFSPDGADVTYWTRRSGSSPASTWAVPVLGGQVRPYLDGMVEPDWSQAGTRLVYHTPGAGDPMFVRDAAQQPLQIFSAAAGLHAHFPVWSPDQSFIYFVLGAVPPGAVPDRTDIWRIASSGGTPERITNHNARVSHPVFLDARTLLYLASESDGTGPSLYSVDVLRRTPPKRESFGIERYTTLAASADGSRVVATRSTGRRTTLWRIPLRETPVDSSAAQRISLTTGNGFAPRFGRGFLLYLSSKGDSDSIWKLQGETAMEVWSAPGARVTGAPSIAADGSRITFVAERNRQTSLYVTNADGTNTRPLTSGLQLQGAPAWAPDGRSVTVGAVVDGTSRLLNVPVDGGPPRTMVNEYAVDPAWSTDGTLLAYSGSDIGTAFQLKVIARDGKPLLLSTSPLRRGSRHLAFMASKRLLVVMRGEIEHKDLSLIDIETAAERQLTRFPADFIVRDFDISPDGRDIVVEQVQENSEIVLIERPRH
jgi:Tol biopolymer transport system component